MSRRQNRLLGRCMVMMVLIVSICFFVMGAEDNLLKNPGFEEVAENQSWNFYNGGQDSIRGSIQAQNYHGGLKAVKVLIPMKPRTYASWVQHVSVDSEENVPGECSIWYLAPDNDCELIITPVVLQNGKPITKPGIAAKLPKTGIWQKFIQPLELLPDTRRLMVELRMSHEGEYLFDDACLLRCNAKVQCHPDRLVLVGMNSGQPIPQLMQNALTDTGYKKISYVQWEDLSPALLKQSRTVVLALLPRIPILTDHDKAIADLLVEYANAGGGLLLNQSMGQTVNSMTIIQYLANRFDAKILLEEVISDKSKTQKLSPWCEDKYNYTTDVYPPVNEGVGGVFYQSAVYWGSYCGVLPFQAGDGWKIVLDAGPNSYSIPRTVGLIDYDRELRNTGFSTKVPLAGVRDFGKGRVGYLGIHQLPIWSRQINSEEGEKLYASYMTDGKGQDNGLLRFCTNMLTWLSANADALESTNLKLAESKRDRFRKDWKLYKGVIGARTTYSIGHSTPDDYVKKAKAAGLDFIVFLEDFAALKNSGMDNLRKDCERLTDETFLALPGLTYTNTDGNHEYVFSDSVRLLSPSFLDPTGKHVKVYNRDARCAQSKYVGYIWNYYLMSLNQCQGWYDFKKNPYPFYDARMVNSMGVVFQKGPHVAERVPEAYGETCSTGQELWPMAITLIDNAVELDHVRNGSLYVNVIGANGLERVYKAFTTFKAWQSRHLYPWIPPFGTMFLSSGPIIELTMPRSDTDVEGDIYSKRLQSWPMKLKVTSDAGLKEVRIMDGASVARRFTPNGAKMFEFETTLSTERQKYIWVHAFDTKGGEAIGRSIGSNSWLLRDQNCMDRCNQLMDSFGKRPDGTPFNAGYPASSPTPDKGPWNGRFSPIGAFVFDKKLGVSAGSADGAPDDYPQIHMNPYLLWEGKYPQNKGWLRNLLLDREGAPHCRAHRVVGSSDVMVADRIMDGVFPLNVPEVIHVWQSIYPITPSKFLKTTARSSYYLVKPDGLSIYLWDQTFEILQDIPVSEKVPFAVCVGNIMSKGAKEIVREHHGKTVESFPVGARAVSNVPFDNGDYIGILKSNFGSMAVYNLGSELVLRGDGVNYSLGIPWKQKVLKAGTKFRVKLLVVGIHRMVTDPAAMAKKVSNDYGLTGGVTVYHVDAKQGKVISQEYILDLESGPDACFIGTVSGLDKLDGNLGCRLNGLNDNWTAFMQIQDDKGRTRMIPVEDSVGYFVLREEENGRPLFIGHPIVADNSEVVLSVSRSKDWVDWILEIHNPTDKEIKTNVKNSPYIAGIKFNENLTLAPGTSVIRNLGKCED